MNAQFTGLHIRVTRRLLARVDACASEEGLSRAEWCRVALSSAAAKSEREAAMRPRPAATGGSHRG